MGVEDIEMIAIDKERNEIQIIPICTLVLSQNKEIATDFIDFVASEKGKASLKNMALRQLNS